MLQDSSGPEDLITIPEVSSNPVLD
jgi:hypothetical protein